MALKKAEIRAQSVEQQLQQKVWESESHMRTVE